MATMSLCRKSKELGYRSYGTADDLGLDPDGGKWVVICETHCTVVNVPTLQIARETATYEFCDECPTPTTHVRSD